MALPSAFLSRMENMLGSEYSAFLQSYSADKVQALRTNPLKISAEKLRELLPFDLEEIHWSPNGFYYPIAARPGKSPFHDAGLFYIQEPSAQLPAVLLNAKPGERVLDLCAAPGGKTTQIAGAMQNSGLLVANEPYPARAKVLSQNVERLGITNALITCALPDKLEEYFPEFFDKIMVDAPCSGEGMFRKDENTVSEWSEDIVSMCANRQWDILKSAYNMLRPGGSLVYSTCTFAPDEDERIISRLISELNMEVINCEIDGVSAGRPEWSDGNEQIKNTFRIWPHISRGEGHFAALLKKSGDGYQSDIPMSSTKEIPELTAFLNDTFKNAPKGNILVIRDEVYFTPIDTSALRGLHIVRSGLHLGTLKKNRFEPSHALSLASKAEDLIRVYDTDEREILLYLRGETLNTNGNNGWTLVTHKGYSVGWGKVSNGILKNHYPKGLRRMGNED